MRILAFLFAPKMRPFAIMIGAIVILALMDRGTGYFLSLGTVFSVMQLFATLGLVALGLGLSMLVREFDLSVASMVGLAGCIAVMTGVANPWIGVVFGVGAGVLAGALQGFIMTRLGLSSVGVTLGGLLTLQGITYVLTANRTISYPNMTVALGLNAPIGGLLSVRSAVALGVFVITALVMAFTHIGRDVVRDRQRPPRQHDRGRQDRPRGDWRIRRLRRILRPCRRVVELQPRRGLAGRPR